MRKSAPDALSPISASMLCLDHKEPLSHLKFAGLGTLNASSRAPCSSCVSILCDAPARMSPRGAIQDNNEPCAATGAAISSTKVIGAIVPALGCQLSYGTLLVGEARSESDPVEDFPFWLAAGYCPAPSRASSASTVF
jgi:hypothetical protein